MPTEDKEVGVSSRKSYLLKKLKEVEYFQFEPGIKSAAADGGFYSKKVRKILTYAPGKLWFWLEPFTSREITVCNSFKTWFVIILYDECILLPYMYRQKNISTTLSEYCFIF